MRKLHGIQLVQAISIPGAGAKASLHPHAEGYDVEYDPITGSATVRAKDNEIEVKRYNIASVHSKILPDPPPPSPSPRPAPKTRKPRAKKK